MPPTSSRYAVHLVYYQLDVSGDRSFVWFGTVMNAQEGMPGIDASSIVDTRPDMLLWFTMRPCRN